MFDTHCHLNFSAFEGILEKVIAEAKEIGVEKIVIPGTDVKTSMKAIEIAKKFDGVYAAVGIHPHHIYEVKSQKSKVKSYNLKLKVNKLIKQVEELLTEPKVVAVGEIGLDRHIYQKTKYEDYQIDEEFIALQIEVFLAQLKLAKKYKKTVIIHNREAKKDLLEILTNNQSLIKNNSLVFHCCEPDLDLLNFAKKHHIYIGVDGDITYDEKKQEFVKKIPPSLLVLETDAPFLTPRIQHLRGETATTSKVKKVKKEKIAKFPNTPKNLILIAKKVAQIKKEKIKKIIKVTKENGKKLFKNIR